MTPSCPFDAWAEDYDTRFSSRLAAAWLRGHVHERVSPLLSPGEAVIELGCGTGEDAVWFARRGHAVWAADASEGMLARARAKIDALDLGARIELQRIDLAHWRSSDVPAGFRARLVFSNFGVLNCVERLEPLLRTARECLVGGGYLALCLMGRFCLWESVHFALRGRFGAAARRWRGGSRYEAGGAEHPVWYHSPRQLADQAEGFVVRDVCGIGGLLPTSEGFGLCERWPRLFGRLAEWDRRLARRLYPISDHYLMILEKAG